MIPHTATKEISKRDPLASTVLEITRISIGRTHVSLREILDAAGLEGPTLAAALLSLPFLQPIPIPGLSTPIGISIALSGLGLFLEREVKLPRKISAMNLPVTSLLKATEFLAHFEVKLKPYLRSEDTHNKPLDLVFTRHILGLAILIHGALLALPLPVPFSNMMPAWMCFIASLTVLFESRRLFWLSMTLLLANVAFWAALIYATFWGSSSLVEWLGLTS